MTESGTLERDRLAITRGMERAVALLRESGRDGRMANPARCVDVFDNCQTTPIFAGLGDTGHHRSKSGTLEGWRAEYPGDGAVVAKRNRVQPQTIGMGQESESSRASVQGRIR